MTPEGYRIAARQENGGWTLTPIDHRLDATTSEIVVTSSTLPDATARMRRTLAGFLGVDTDDVELFLVVDGDGHPI